MTTTPLTAEELASRAARDVEGNPREVCRDFESQPDHPWWCATCKWNEALHHGEEWRAAVAAELHRMATPTTGDPR